MWREELKTSEDRGEDYGPGGGWRPLFKDDGVVENELPRAQEPLVPDEEISSAFVDCLTCLIAAEEREDYIRKLREVRSQKEANKEIVDAIDRRAAERACAAAMLAERDRKCLLCLKLYALDEKLDGLISAKKAIALGVSVVEETGAYLRVADAIDTNIRRVSRYTRRKVASDLDQTARSIFYTLDSCGCGYVNKEELHSELLLRKEGRHEVLFDMKTEDGSILTLQELERILMSHSESQRATRALRAAALHLSSKRQLERSKKKNTHLIFRDQLKKSAQREFARRDCNTKLPPHQVDEMAQQPGSFMRQIPARCSAITHAWVPFQSRPYIEFGTNGRTVLEIRLAVAVLPLLIASNSFPSAIDCVLQLGNAAVHQTRIPLLSRENIEENAFSNGPLIAFRSEAIKADATLKFHLLQSPAGRHLSHASIDLSRLDPALNESKIAVTTINLISLDVGTAGLTCADHDLRILAGSSSLGSSLTKKSRGTCV